MPDKSLVEILFASVLRLPSRFGLKASSRLPSVLLASALDALTARKLKYGDHPWLPTDAWRRVAQNKDERYQVLEPYADVHPGLLVDFKQVFSVSTDYLYAVLNHSPSTFLCSMAVPYREHLSSRFAYFMSRVALPRDHDDPAPIAPAKLPK